jgi:hypothetical protein
MHCWSGCRCDVSGSFVKFTLSICCGITLGLHEESGVAACIWLCAAIVVLGSAGVCILAVKQMKPAKSAEVTSYTLAIACDITKASDTKAFDSSQHARAKPSASPQVRTLTVSAVLCISAVSYWSAASIMPRRGNGGAHMAWSEHPRGAAI